jgi:hypothetical protein
MLKKLDPLESQTSLNESNWPGNPEELRLFLETPHGQQMKAEAIVSYATEMIPKIVEKIQSPGETPLAQMWLLHLALKESVDLLQRNEELLATPN